MAQGETVGNTTLGDLTIGALERLFNALPRCPCACVVVTNLKDDVYLDGSGQLRTLIESLTKHYDRNAQAITPVQQNTGEVFAIVRKRLFDGLPSPDKIDEVAQAYVSALQKAKRVDTIPTTPETFIERIRETYPFHPSIRDIAARFAENRGYQKTRALIRLMRLAVRGALAGNGNVFLIGLQHLDFNDQATIEEIRKINPGYSNAISRDVADRGNALAEKIDVADGNPTASAVAKVLLMSSLSAAESPLRGLTDGELIETLVDPLSGRRLLPAQAQALMSALFSEADIEAVFPFCLGPQTEVALGHPSFWHPSLSKRAIHFLDVFGSEAIQASKGSILAEREFRPQLQQLCDFYLCIIEPTKKRQCISLNEMADPKSFHISVSKILQCVLIFTPPEVASTWCVPPTKYRTGTCQPNGPFGHGRALIPIAHES
jgi:hypothetical protein